MSSSPSPRDPGLLLAEGEIVLRHVALRRSNLDQRRLVALTLSNRRLEVRRRATVLGFIPAGVRRSSYPLGNIAAIEGGSHLFYGRLVLGILIILLGAMLAVAGLGSASDTAAALGWLGVLLFLAGIPVTASAWWTGINVTNNGGGTDAHRIAFIDRAEAARFAAEAARQLAEREKDR